MIHYSIQQGVDPEKMAKTLILDHFISALQTSDRFSKVFVHAIVNSGNINFANHKGTTALMAAAISGNSDLVSILLSCGADLNLQDCEGENALSSAKLRGGSRAGQEVVDLLLEAGAKYPPLRERKRVMIIFERMAKDHPDFVYGLLSANDINYKSQSGSTALSILLDKTMNQYSRQVNSVGDKKVDTFRSITESHACVLVAYGSDPNTQCEDGESVIVLSARFGYSKLTEMLINAGANVLLSPKDSAEVFCSIARFDMNPYLVTVLEEAGADMSYRHPITKDTIAHIVCRECSHRTDHILQYFFQSKVDINQQNHVGQNCLMLACMVPRSNVNIPAVLRYTDDVNAQDDDGNTAITLLSTSNMHHLPLLVSQGGDIYHLNAAGESLGDREMFGINMDRLSPELVALMKSCRKGDPITVRECLEVLKCRSAIHSINWKVLWNDYPASRRRNVGNSYWLTALMHAVECPVNTKWNTKGDRDQREITMREIVSILIDHGADIDAVDNHGETALMKAINLKHRAMAFYLLERGANWRIYGQLKNLTYYDCPIQRGRSFRPRMGESALHVAYLRNERLIACRILDAFILEENRGDASNTLQCLVDDVREQIRCDPGMWNILQSRVNWARRRPLLLCLYQCGVRHFSIQQKYHLDEPQANIMTTSQEVTHAGLVAVLQNTDLLRSICSFL